MTTLMLWALLQDEAPKDIYEEIQRRNVFSPRVEKPKKVEDNTPKGPPPPVYKAFSVNGLWWDPIDKAYVAYVMDGGGGKTIKVGDTYRTAKILHIDKDVIKVEAEGKEQVAAVGGSFSLLVEGEVASAPPPKPEEKPAEPKPAEPTTASKPPEEKPKPKEGKGLLDWFRTRKKPE